MIGQFLAEHSALLGSRLSVFASGVSSMSGAAAAPSVSTQVVFRRTTELEVISTLKAQKYAKKQAPSSCGVSFYILKRGLKGNTFCCFKQKLHVLELCCRIRLLIHRLCVLNKLLCSRSHRDFSIQASVCSFLRISLLRERHLSTVNVAKEDRRKQQGVKMCNFHAARLMAEGRWRGTKELQRKNIIRVTITKYLLLFHLKLIFTLFSRG